MIFLIVYFLIYDLFLDHSLIAMLKKRNTIYEKCFFMQPNNALFKKLFHFSFSVNINSTYNNTIILSINKLNSL